MIEQNPDEQIDIARTFLWTDIVETFQNNAFMLGMQPCSDIEPGTFSKPTRLVLVSGIKNEEGYDVQLWGEVTTEAIIGKVTLLFISDDLGEEFNYEITPETISQYSLEPTPLDHDDIQDLRADIAETQWGEISSQACAKSVIFFS